MTTQSGLEVPARSRSGPRAMPRSGWRLGTGLVLLSAVPLTVGALRLAQLAGAGSPLPADPRFDGLPVALVLHIVGAAVFALLGALQLLSRFRRRHLTWHRRTGRVLVAAGLVVAGSALWLTLFYAAQPGTGPLLYALRLVAAAAMTVSIVKGFVAILRRDIASHRAWMVRAYALALGAGTQVLTEGLGQAALGEGVLVGDLAKGAGWVVNLLVAEWAIRRGSGRRS